MITQSTTPRPKDATVRRAFPPAETREEREIIYIFKHGALAGTFLRYRVTISHFALAAGDKFSAIVTCLDGGLAEQQFGFTCERSAFLWAAAVAANNTQRRIGEVQR